MNIEEIDFYELCLEEGHPSYSEIFKLDKMVFNDWMRDNLVEISTIKSYDNVLPSEKVFNDFVQKGYEHIHYQCHYSSKALSILDENYKYFTGFVERNTLDYSIITHSFNIKDYTIVDFARINDPEYQLTEEECGLPNIYYGIEIPRDFVLNYQEETFEDKSMKPLLYEWFLENN
jgi:glutamate mutase epsilon subunit